MKTFLTNSGKENGQTTDGRLNKLRHKEQSCDVVITKLLDFYESIATEDHQD